MDIIKSYSGLIALVILAIMGLSGALKDKSNLVGSTSCGSITCLAGGLRLVSDLGGTFEVDVASTISAALNVTGLTTLAALVTTGDATVGGGTVTVTTTNTATSTATAGCIQTYATSTATPVKLQLTLAAQAGGSVYSTSTNTGVTGIGGVVWAFGACPNL